MSNFWTTNTASAEIFIYGEISREAWLDSDVTAKDFARDLSACAGSVTVHINSPGGDVFAALAIANLIKQRGSVTVSIDGLAASAASLIAVSAPHVIMASNALMMIHSPSVLLTDYYDEQALAKVQQALQKTGQALIETYSARAKNCNVQDLLKTETWFTAEEAKAAGFVDEISGSVDMQISDTLLTINNLSVPLTRFNALEVKLMNKPLEEKYAASVRAAELQRIKSLQALKCENSAVNAIIEVALAQGASAAEVEKYINAVKAIPSTLSLAEELRAVIKDQMQSGAQSVPGSVDPADPKATQVAKLASIANGLI